jgi:uncharacterized membrane protein
MAGAKSMFTSKTILGAIVLLLASLFNWFGIEVGTEELTRAGTLIADLLGIFLVVWGRWTAKTKLILPCSKNVAGGLIIIALLLPGCAFKDLTVAEIAEKLGSVHRAKSIPTLEEFEPPVDSLRELPDLARKDSN